MPSQGDVRWLPLESNPEVINKYINNLGVSTDQYEFVDIYGLDPELLQMVPRPIVAVVLLFPINKNYTEYIEKVKEEVTKNGQRISNQLYFTRQTVQNACGTVALIHALTNNRDLLEIQPDKPFDNYLKGTVNLSSDERAAYLENDREFTSVHSDSAQEGQTDTPNLEDEVDLHFITFVEKEGDLYELDGAKPFPINHGPIDENTLLENTSEVVKKLMALTPDEVRFTLIGLVSKEN